MASENHNSNQDLPDDLYGATEVEYDDLGRPVMATFPHGALRNVAILRRGARAANAAGIEIPRQR